MPLSQDDESELERLHDSIQTHPDDPSLRFQLGVLLWEQNDKEKSAEQFVIAAKLNPEIEKGAAFRYLGLYYESSSSSLQSQHGQRALKCLQKAVSINPDDSVSGEALCDLLDQQGKETLEAAVCGEASGRFRGWGTCSFIRISARKLWIVFSTQFVDILPLWFCGRLLDLRTSE